MKKILTFFCLVFVLHVYSQPSNFSLLGRWADGFSAGVVVKNNVAFLGNGSSITLLDISKPEKPEKISSVILPDVVTDLTVNGNYVYVAAGIKGLVVIDVSNIDSPVKIGTYENYNPSRKVVFHNNTIYLITSSGVDIIDVSTPSSPTKAGSLFNSNIQDICFEGNYAFAACNENGLFVYDVSNPQTPLYKSAIQNGYYIRCSLAKDNYLYTGEGNNLRVFDITDIDSIKEYSVIEATISKMTFVGDTIYSVSQFGALTIADVSNPQSPTITGALPAMYFRGISGIAAKGANIFVTEQEKGLHVLDASSHSNIKPVGKYVTASYFTKMVLTNNQMFASDFRNGLFVFDVSNNASPICLSKTNPDSLAWYNSLATKDNYLYLASNTGFYIFDVTAPETPVEVKKVALSKIVNLQVNGNFLYASSQVSPGFVIYDISDPENPVEKGSLPDASAAFTVKDNYVYLINKAESGFSIVDVSQPANPNVKSFSGVSNISYYRDITVLGNYAFSVGHGINITDISDAENPNLVGVYYGIDYGSSVSVVGKDIYVGNEDGLAVVSYVDAANPVMVNKFDTPNTYTAKLCTNQSVVYLFQAKNGMYVLNNDLPTKIISQSLATETKLLQNFPNPFHHKTYIRYKIQKAGSIDLEVIDINGRVLKKIDSGFKYAGKYTVEWKPQNNFSGELFYRLKFNGETVQTKKMIKK